MTVIRIMPHATLCPEGKTIEAAPGTSVCEALLENGVEIEHAYDMSCACTTCHVIVREGFEALDPATEKEDDLLDKAWGLELTSRLSCQARMTESDVTVEIPKYTLNQVSESKQ